MNTTSKHGCIDNIELAVSDIERSKAFYGQVFGWKFKTYGPRYCEFSDGRLFGGLTTLSEVRSSGGPLIIIYTENLLETLKAVRSAGATIIKPIFSFPGGRRFHFIDLDGYELAVWSDDEVQ